MGMSTLVDNVIARTIKASPVTNEAFPGKDTYLFGKAASVDIDQLRAQAKPHNMSVEVLNDDVFLTWESTT